MSQYDTVVMLYESMSVCVCVRVMMFCKPLANNSTPPVK